MIYEKHLFSDTILDNSKNHTKNTQKLYEKQYRFDTIYEK